MLNKTKTIDGYEGTYNAFTKEILKACFSQDMKENLVLSPLSVLVLLSMLAGSTAGDSRREILALIDGGNYYEQTRQRIKDLQKRLASKGSLSCANAVCVKSEIGDKIKSDYIEELRRFYSGEFFSSSDIVGEVNAWAAKKTNGMIEDALDESMAEMLACLINAVAFDSKWEEQYEDNDIWDEEFTDISNKSSDVPMLHSEEYRYIEDELYTGFIKDYKGEEYSFMGLLPNKCGTSQIIRCLKVIDFTNAFKSAVNIEVQVTMPEFSCSSDYDISGFCNDMGIVQAFTPDADFSPMSDEWIKVEKILHKAKIELDRSGTKAAAITEAVLYAGCAFSFTDYKTVKLNRPFIYAIMHNETQLPVFVGVVNHL